MNTTAEQSTAGPAIPRSTSARVVGGVVWTIKFLVALFFFVGALQLMKTGASTLDVLKPGGFLVRNPVTTLGLGWLGALFVLSGSPIAATALTLVKAGEEAARAGAAHFTEIQGFTMLTGSRLGAAFVVLVVAVIYALRGGEGERVKPVSTAVLALSTTAMIYIPGAALGYALLKWGPFHSMELTFPHQFADVIDLIYGGILDRVGTWPSWVVFLGGLGVLLLSFKLIDAVMPSLDETTIGEKRLAWLRGKWSMFGLGSIVALITMSVSVALTVLVPLVAKKYVKREDIMPYIMGANITTLGDTMLAAFALHSPAAVRIVLAEVIATSILSVLLLAFFYPQIRRGVWKFQRAIVRSKPRL
ncbi:MAG: hypothetical protein QOG16_688, partial [Actinomycetota bacterium]|nr:hypothetical protein [Actinomycetota bacterium]